jgi:dipeptidyl-peptidase-4
MKIKRWTTKLVLLYLAFCFAGVGLVSGQESKRLTIERLYSLPWLIGTGPRGYAWSPNSERLAFLWNDEGTNFCDVWIVDVDDPKPVRLTRMTRPTAEPVPGDPIASIEREVRVERDRGVQAVTWHPDNRRVLVSFRGDHFLAELGKDPVQVTSTTGVESRAAYSPDGRFLAYILGGDLWLEDAGVEGRGEPRQITRLATDSVRIRSFAWSPDGDAIAFIEMDESKVPIRKIPDYLLEETDVVSIRRPLPGEESASRRLGVVQASGGDVQWMDLGSNKMDPIFGYRWSPDGQRLLVNRSDLYVKDRRVLIFDSKTGTARELYREQNPLNVHASWQSEWAPDGKGIYFLSDRDEDYHIYYLPEEGGSPSRITQGDWAVSGFHVSAGAISFVANKGRPEERQIFRVGLKGGEPVRVSERAGTHAPTMAPDGRYAADYFSSDEMPPELLLVNVDPGEGAGPKEHRVTTSPIPEFSDYRWVKAQYVTFPSLVDGVTLHGRLTLPPDLDRSKKHPAILGSVYSNTVRNQWGGRTAHPTWGLDQYLVQEGYILLNVNFRGSWGHGKAFRQRLRLDYGGIDVEDLASGVEYLKSLGFVDMDRVGIWGSSYGGLLTCMSLFKKPGLYKAGVAGAPATNVWHATTGEMMVMMAPQDQPKEYASSSAFKHAAGLQDHLMIIHGMRDRIVFFKDSLVLVQHLMMLGKDVDFVPVPNSRHGWDNEGLYQTVFTFKKLIGHFERYLGKGPSPD